MENEEKPNYSTQKEESINFPEKPKTMGTSAHPFPKFLPKPIALIVIVLIATALLSGLVFTVYNLGRSSILKELNPTAPVIPPADPVNLASPTPASNAANADPATADWKTYKNNNYSFSYPADHEIQAWENVILLMGPRGKNERSNPVFRIDKIDIAKATDIEGAFEDGLAIYYEANISDKICPPKEPFEECYVRAEDIKINDYAARIFELIRRGEKKGQYAVVKRGNYLYKFSPAFNPKFPNEYTEVDNKILNSLKFTE